MKFETLDHWVRKNKVLSGIFVFAIAGLLWYLSHLPIRLEDARVGVKYQSRLISKCDYSGPKPNIVEGTMPEGLEFVSRISLRRFNWNSRDIYIEGIPQRTGTYAFTIVNSSQTGSRLDTCRFNITIYL